MDEPSKKYHLDKNVFKASSVEEVNHHYAYWKNKSLKERLETTCYLINQFYNTTPQTAIDKTVFTNRKHQNG